MPEAPTRRRFRQGDQVTVIGVPGRPEPAPAVVKMDEVDGLVYVTISGCSYPVDVIRLQLVRAADEAPARG